MRHLAPPMSPMWAFQLCGPVNEHVAVRRQEHRAASKGAFGMSQIYYSINLNWRASMISGEVWLVYLGTVLLFMSTPGPSHLLMISASMSNGFRRSLATAAGDLSANAIQMMLAGLGLAAIVTTSRYGFAVIKWAGVAYLVWMGVRQIISSYRQQDGQIAIAPASALNLWLRGFVTSAANPKAIVFFAALFPQFIDPARNVAGQLAVLGITYLLIDGMFLAAYGKGASLLAARVSGASRMLIDRVAGAGMIGAAIPLGLRTNDSN